jgi:oxygen-independent coproporphyrinogen-3 oxidase
VDEDSRLGLEILCGGTRYGAANAPSDDLIAELYEYAVERLRGLGLERYEISNFSRAGCESHHNLKYWLLEPYVGFGADAHSFDGEKRRQNVEGAEEYIARGGDACASEVPADPGERLMVGLRLTRGIEMLPSERRAHEASLRRFADAGLVESEGAMLRLTARGVLLANEVFQEFVPCPSPS